eukprot:888106-Prymnesium_polylepis.1
MGSGEGVKSGPAPIGRGDVMRTSACDCTFGSREEAGGWSRGRGSLRLPLAATSAPCGKVRCRGAVLALGAARGAHANGGARETDSTYTRSRTRDGGHGAQCVLMRYGRSERRARILVATRRREGAGHEAYRGVRPPNSVMLLWGANNSLLRLSHPKCRPDMR